MRDCLPNGCIFYCNYGDQISNYNADICYVYYKLIDSKDDSVCIYESLQKDL